MSSVELPEMSRHADDTRTFPENETAKGAVQEATETYDDARKKPPSPVQRRWQSLSPLWRRIIIIAAILFVAMIITLIVVLIVVLRPKAEHQKPRPAIASNGQTDNATASEFSDPPFKLGLLTNFPDPSLYYDTGSKTWYAFGTNQAAGILDLDRSSSDLSHLSVGNIQMAKSTDFQTWALANTSADPLPNPGNWTKQGATDITSLPYHDGFKNNASSSQVHLQVPRANVWAPELLHRPSDGKWVIYYTAANSFGAAHCIGAGVSASPGGPFTPVDQPFICPIEAGGAIDPAVFVDETDSNTVYLAYKVDGDVRGHGGECSNMVPPIQATPLMLQRMEDDGITVDSSFKPVQLLDRIDEDGPLIEAPSLVKAGDYYFLFYSSGCTRFPDYALRYAWSPSLFGPYTRAEPALVKTGESSLTAPGSATIRFAQYAPKPSSEGTTGSQMDNNTSGSWRIALHGRVNTTIGGVRAFFTAGLTFNGNSVSLVDGTVSVT